MAFSEAKDAIEVSSWIRRNWEKRTTIIVALLALALGGLYLCYAIDIAEVSEAITWQELLSLVLLLGLLWIIWHQTRKPPITKQGKIGIAIAIACETKKEKTRLKTEFIQALRSEIKRGSHQHFDVFELSEYHSERIIDQESTIKYQRLTKTHLLIFGQCRSRTHEGQASYILDLHARVSHKPIPLEVSEQFSNDMRQVFPAHSIIPESEEVLGFQATKEMVLHAARFTLGAASLLSQDPITAFDLHHSLWQETRKLIDEDENANPGYKLIRNRLPGFLVAAGLLSARFYLVKRPSGYLDRMNRYLDIVQEIDPNNYEAHLVRAIYFFLHDHDIEKAKREIKKAKNSRNSAWQYSEAFLAAYEGDLETAHKIYKRAFKGIVSPATPLDVELFIHDVLDAEPQRFQLWYCLGMVNYFSKGDLASAEKDFLKFVELAESRGSFRPSVEFAKKYVEEIRGTTKANK